MAPFGVWAGGRQHFAAAEPVFAAAIDSLLKLEEEAAAKEEEKDEEEGAHGGAARAKKKTRRTAVWAGCARLNETVCPLTQAPGAEVAIAIWNHFLSLAGTFSSDLQPCNR